MFGRVVKGAPETRLKKMLINNLAEVGESKTDIVRNKQGLLEREKMRRAIIRELKKKKLQEKVNEKV